jgi:hypothetical protein
MCGHRDRDLWKDPCHPKVVKTNPRKSWKRKRKRKGKKERRRSTICGRRSRSAEGLAHEAFARATKFLKEPQDTPLWPAKRSLFLELLLYYLKELAGVPSKGEEFTCCCPNICVGGTAAG